MNFEVYDLETIINLFTYTGYDCINKTWTQFVICNWRNDIDELVKHLSLLKQNRYYMVGFNNENFDYPIIHHILNHYEEYKHMTGQEIAQDIYEKAQALINNTNSDGKQFNTIADKNKYIRQIDLFKIWHYNNKARATSLKDLEVCMRMPSVEEMPIPHNAWCKNGDENLVLKYNKNDVEATYLFFKTTLGQTDYSIYKGKNKMKLRQDLQKKFNVACLNLPDVGMGEQLMLNLYSRAVNKNPFDIKKLRTNRTSIKLKDCIPSWANVKSKPFKKFIDEIQSIDLTVPVPKGSFEFTVKSHNYHWDFGLGGSHGCIRSGVYTSNNEQIIVDLDVSSLYPSIAKSLNLYPEHLGPEFMELYSQFIDDRIAEKHKPKAERDNVLIEGYKLILNGTYGKSNEETSFMYDPLYTFKTTIAGQIFICMWSERMIEACPDIIFLQTNTDGQTILIPRDKLNAIRAVNEQLTKETTLVIEEVLYDKMIIRDVNNYIAIKNGWEPGKSERDYLKMKGDFEIDKEYHKDPSMRIVPLAVKEYFVNGIKIEDTIRNHTDIFDFCLRLKTNSQSTGIFTHLVNSQIVTDKLNRTTRYYISKSGKAGSLAKKFNDGRIVGVNIGYSAILFNEYEEKSMEDYKIDYGFYIAEAYKLKNAVDDGQLSLFNF